MPLEKAELGTDLAQALFEIPRSELQRVVTYLQKKHPQMDELTAFKKARKDYRRNGIVRSRQHHKEKQLQPWRQVRGKWAEQQKIEQQQQKR